MVRYAFLGPAGTFSEEALLALDIPGVEPVDCTSIGEVFEAAEAVAEAGPPIENSIEGSVSATLDGLVFDTALEIQHELVLDIHFSLVAAPGASMADISSVVAHPQASGQCRRWLERHMPGRPVVAANSNAEAVQTAVATPGVAALGPSIAADLYGAQILQRGVEDYAGNQTRFVVIGRGICEHTGKDKTSLALFMKKDKPGALLMILSEFAYGDIN
jgi:prephenate dehydratase